MRDATLQGIALEKAKINTNYLYLAFKKGDLSTGDVSMSCLIMATEVDKKDTMAEYMSFSGSACDI